MANTQGPSTLNDTVLCTLYSQLTLFVWLSHQEVAYFTQSVETTHASSQSHWMTEIRTNSDVVCFSSRPRDQEFSDLIRNQNHEGWVNLASKMFLANAGLQPLQWKLSVFSRAEEEPDLPWTPSLSSLQELVFP